MNRQFLQRIATLLLAVAATTGCTPEPQIRVVSGATMGTTYTVKVVAVAPAPQRLADSIQARLDELDALLSTFRTDSDVSRFNATDSTDWFDISADTLLILEQSLRISAATDGAFDVTVGPLVSLWGFGPEGASTELPDQQTIDRLLAATGYRFLAVRESPPAVRRTRPGVRIDLSAIAKGHAVDQAAVVLDEAGVENYLVEIGGEVRTRGSRADGKTWRVALENPVAESSEIGAVVSLRDESIATSGDYRNFFERDGVRYSHAIDPRTGWPVSHGLGAVSVIDASALTADAWATALMVLGPEQGLQLATREGLVANFVVRTDRGHEELPTPAFAAWMTSRAGAAAGEF